MPSNYTANYQLNQWEADDLVLRTDFNADNAKIDTALGMLEGKIAHIKAGWFWGTGTASQNIELGFCPNAVLVFSNSQFGGSPKCIYGGLATINCLVELTVGSTVYPAVTIHDTWFTVYETTTSDPSAAVHCNTEGARYAYLAIKV